MNISGGGLTSLEELDVTNMKFPVNATYMFGGLPSVKSIDLTNVDTTLTTRMDAMFLGDSSLESIDVNDFDTSNVTNMVSMFQNCSNIAELDLTSFNTSNVTNMASMFSGASKITDLDLSSFNTSNVTTMASMFSGCSELTTIKVTDNFVTTNVTETDNSKDMFKDASSLVGGRGTTYDANKIDKEYAHIDGGLLDPGYFTDKNAIRTTFDPNGGITYQTVIQSAENDVIDAPIPYTVSVGKIKTLF
jgi:surface protein